MVPIGRRHCSRPSSIFGRRAEGNFGLPFSDSARAHKRLLLTIMERKTYYHVKLDDIIVDILIDGGLDFKRLLTEKEGVSKLAR
jgi:hypothetical protein